MSLAIETGEMLITVEFAGFSLPTSRCEIDEGMSQPDRVYVEIGNPNDIDFGPLLDTEFEVVITIAGVEARRLTRKLASATFLRSDEGNLHYGLELRPTFWFLIHSKNTRKWRDTTTEAIIDKVLGEAGVAHNWRTRRPCKSRPFCVQYRESTKTFVERLLEYEGIYYYFEEGGTMVLADTSSAELMVDGLPVYSLLENAGALESALLGLTSISKGASVGSGHATVNDFNFKTPDTSLLQTAAGATDPDLEIYDYPTGYRDTGVGATLAKLRLEALVAEKRFVDGTSNVPQFAAARLLTVVHGEAVDFSGQYLLVRVRHVFQRVTHGNEREAARVASYENEFFAIPAHTPWRPPLVTPHPVIQGNHTATVRGPAGEEIHTDVYGRAKVQFHWDRESKSTDEDSRWIRVLQETSSSMVISRVGWEVVVGYIDGDPDRPVGLARNINGKMMPTYGQPDRKNMMTIKTESYPGKQGYNELRLDDSVGAMRMDIQAQKDHINTVENDKTENVGQNHLHLIKQGYDRSIAKNQTLKVGANETKDVQASYTETIKLNRTETIGGSEKVDVKVTSTMNVTKNERVSIGAVRFTLAGLGAVSLPSPKDIANILVPHVLGQGFDNMLAGHGTVDGGANDGHDAGNTESGGQLGANTTPFAGDGQFAGIGPIGGPSGGGAGGGGASQSGAGKTNGNSSGASSALGLIGNLLDGKQGLSSGLDAIVGQVAGKGPLGAGIQALTGGLTSGTGGLTGAIGQGLQGALGSVAGQGPLGSALGSLTGSGGALGGVGQALASGNFAAVGQSVSKGISSIGANVKQALSPDGLKAMGTELLESLFKGSIAKDSRAVYTRLIGGAQIVAAGGNIMIGSNYLTTEVIGGLKMSTAVKGAVTQSAGKFLIHTVGAMILRKSKEDMSIASTTTQVRVGAQAKMHSDEKFEVRGEVIELEAQTTLTLKSGDLLIELSPEKTTIKGTLKIDSGSKIKIAGKPDKLTA